MKNIAVVTILVLSILCSSCTQPSPKSIFLTETKIELPSESKVIEDLSDVGFQGDGDRRILFSSNKETKERIKDEADRLGYVTSRATNRTMAIPDEMKKYSKIDEVDEFILTKGEKTVYVLISDSHTFMRIVWV